jgi:hypothetical protein
MDRSGDAFGGEWICYKMLKNNGLRMVLRAWHGMCQREGAKVAIRDHQTVDTDRGFLTPTIFNLFLPTL